MGLFASALQDLAAELTTAGVPAVTDPRNLQRPGALLVVSGLESQVAGGRALATVTVTGVHPGPDTSTSQAWLWDVFAPALSAVAGALTFTPGTYADMPSVTADLTLEVTQWP